MITIGQPAKAEGASAHTHTHTHIYREGQKCNNIKNLHTHTEWEKERANNKIQRDEKERKKSSKSESESESDWLIEEEQPKPRLQKRIEPQLLFFLLHFHIHQLTLSGPESWTVATEAIALITATLDSIPSLFFFLSFFLFDWLTLWRSVIRRLL